MSTPPECPWCGAGPARPEHLPDFPCTDLAFRAHLNGDGRHLHLVTSEDDAPA